MSSLFKKAKSGVKVAYKEAYKEVNGVVQQGQQKWAQHQQQQSQPQAQAQAQQQQQQQQPGGQHSNTQYGDQYGQQQYQQPAGAQQQQYDPYGQPPDPNVTFQQQPQATPPSTQYYHPDQPQQELEDYAPPPGPPPSHPSFAQQDQYSIYQAPPEPPQQQQTYQTLPSPSAPAPLNTFAPQSSSPAEPLQSSPIPPAQHDPLAFKLESLTLQQPPIQQSPALEKQLPTSPTVSPEPTPSAQPAQSPPTSRSHELPPPTLAKPSHGCLALLAVMVEANPPYVLHPQTRAQLGIEELDLAICANCFAAHVAPYPSLAPYFVLYHSHPRDPNSRARMSYSRYTCDLGLPRGLQTVRQCAAQTNIQPLLGLPQVLSKFQDCMGVLKPSTEGMWTVQEDNECGLCHACYELHIRSTPFERHFYFKNGTITETESQWACDLGLGGAVSRMLTKELLSPSPDYSRWVSISIARHSLRFSCPGVGIALTETQSDLVYAAKAPDIGIFCHSCYYDHVFGTPLESVCHEIQLPPEQLATTACNLASSFSQFAMRIAVRRGDFSVWTKAVEIQPKVPACVGLIGVDEAELRSPQEFHWYKLCAHPNIEICPSCYHICIQVFGMDSLFERLDRPLVDGLVRQCFLTLVVEDDDHSVDDINSFTSTVSWRGKVLRDGIAFNSVSHGDIRPFNAYAELIAAMPPPCFMNSRVCLPANNRQYLGHSANPDDPDDFHFAVCAECFANHVKGTDLEYMMTDKTAAINALPEGFVCQSHTLRVRRVLSEAMTRGDWEHFAEYWRKRQEVFQRFLAAKARYDAQMQKQLAMKAQVDMQGQMMAINLMQSLNANQNAIISGIGGSVAEAAASDNGQRFGNSSVGHGYLTANGARAAMDQQQALQFAAQMPVKDINLYQDSGNTISDSYVIQAIWDEVKKEWEAIQ
ncbi:unnamed protein product [Clonostachys chloroleuca]|uniref:Uncharacterized protein n=1 Tax=Clonostachys chloroleuca TaxID=1926264 RepID=A0AA35M6X7_9HYPO|nr:unnamed protein product [Clonostachys chloroleuca]